jgi:hypothetical protein
LPIEDFGQQHLNDNADQSATRGQVLPHFQQIVSGALMPLCPIAAVFLFLCGQLLVLCWSVSRSVQNKGSRALGVSLQKENYALVEAGVSPDLDAIFDDDVTVDSYLKVFQNDPSLSIFDTNDVFNFKN